MEKVKINKKDIAVLISESVNNTVGSIDKAKGGKKLKKLIARSSKKIAGRVAEQIKRDDKKSQRASKSLKKVEKVLNGESKKEKKVKTEKGPK
jgi:Ethanolamine utilization protein EutJ (predicted chaperonin)